METFCRFRTRLRKKKRHNISLVFLSRCYFVSFLLDLSLAGVASHELRFLTTINFESATLGEPLEHVTKKRLCNMKQTFLLFLFFLKILSSLLSEVLLVSISLTNRLGPLLSLFPVRILCSESKPLYCQ